MMRDAEFAFDLDPACQAYQCGEGGAEDCHGRPVCRCAAAKALAGSLPLAQPDRPGFRGFERELGQVDQGADRGMTGAQHGDRLAGIARAILPQHSGMP